MEVDIMDRGYHMAEGSLGKVEERELVMGLR